MAEESVFDIEQSLPICIALAVIGGLFEVAATACTALPSVQAAQLKTKGGWFWKYLALAGNISLQTFGSIMSHLVATWFGPIAIVVPFFYSSTLLCNMIIFGALLGIEFFTKTAKTGTLVIIVSVILLPVVGPAVQDDQDITVLISKPYSFIWFGLLLITCTITGLLVCFVDISSKFTQRGVVVILLLARASSISINLTVSKGFVSNLDPTSWLFGFFLFLKISSGWIYTFAIVVQSTAIQHQSKFVPLNTTCIITLNALTGILIWEDYKVVASWYGYLCVFCLLGLGCELLLDTEVPLLTDDNPDFGLHRRASVVNVLGQRRRRQSIMEEAYGYKESDHLLPKISENDYDELDEEKAPAITTETVEKKDEKIGDGIPEVVSVENKSPIKSPAVPASKEERGEEDGDDLIQGGQPPALTRREAWQIAIGIPQDAEHDHGSTRGGGGKYGSIFNADRPHRPSEVSSISSVTMGESNRSKGGIISTTGTTVMKGVGTVTSATTKAITATGEKVREGATTMATATTSLISNTGNKVVDSAASVATTTKKNINDPIGKAIKSIGSVFRGGRSNKKKTKEKDDEKK